MDPGFGVMNVSGTQRRNKLFHGRRMEATPSGTDVVAREGWKVNSPRCRRDRRGRNSEVKMCTLIIEIGVVDAPELFVIANRDEALDRPAKPPSVWRCGERRVLAPRDIKAGGTWIGVNEAGVACAITNRFGMEQGGDYRSRGRLVCDALSAGSAAGAIEQLSSWDADEHNGFHLLVADGQRGFVTGSDTATSWSVELEPGFYALTERSFDAANSRRIVELARRLSELDEWSPALRRRLRRWMIEHDEREPLESTCVHLPDSNYGTRSSTIIEGGDCWRMLYADGPPCETSYRDYSDELNELVGG